MLRFSDLLYCNEDAKPSYKKENINCFMLCVSTGNLSWRSEEGQGGELGEECGNTGW